VSEMSDYERRWEAEAARLVASGDIDTDTVRELLILSCHSSQIADAYFTTRLDHQQLLTTLLGLAIEDYSGNAQMTASYWVSRFPLGTLANHIPELEAIAANEWDSVAVHARRTLEALARPLPPQRGDGE
jgi:hypothetical protein